MTTTLPKGSIFLAASLLSDPAQYKSVSEIMRASHLVESFGPITKDAPKGDDLTKWVAEEADFDLTEAQKVLLYQSVERNIGKIPPSIYAIKLLTFLGFE